MCVNVFNIIRNMKKYIHILFSPTVNVPTMRKLQLFTASRKFALHLNKLTYSYSCLAKKLFNIFLAIKVNINGM